MTSKRQSETGRIGGKREPAGQFANVFSPDAESTGISGASRREFLRNGLAFVALGLGIPQYLMQAAHADPAQIVAGGASAGASPSNILVVIELTGGNDGLNTVIPYTNPVYRKVRSTLALPENEMHKISNSLAFHPSMSALAGLYEKGQVAVVNGVGYPKPNRSHFRSMDIWQAGSRDVDYVSPKTTGWIARYFDSDGHLRSNPLSGITVGDVLPLAVYSDHLASTVIGRGDDYYMTIGGADNDRQVTALLEMYAQGTLASSNADFVRLVGNGAYMNWPAIDGAMSKYQPSPMDGVDYDATTDLGAGLQSIAKLICAGVGTRVYYISKYGFDTHAAQHDDHANLLADVSTNVTAFLNDLARRGHGNDVTVMTFSEFGRRVAENGSGGTDHGAGSCVLVAGAGVKGGVHGDYPSLTDLDEGDLMHHTDYRSVYATLLEKRLGSPSEAVFGSQFPLLDFA